MTSPRRPPNRRGLLAAGLGAALAPLTPGAAHAAWLGNRRWTPGDIEVDINSVILHSQRQVILTAIREMNDKTNVNFILWPVAPNRTEPYVRFIDDGTGNNAQLGMPASGPRDVFINKDVRSLHELGHVLGLIHEHQRSDRDQHIEFTPDFQDRARLFAGDADWSRRSDSRNQGLPYNVGSFMHYWDTAGSDTGRRTMILRSDRSLRFGTPEWLNDLAVQAVNNLYPNYAPRKAPVVTPVAGATYVLFSGQPSVYLDAGPNYRRAWAEGEEASNAYLRWEVRAVRDASSFALYNAQRDGYLDAGANHFRAFVPGEEDRNPYLRWELRRRYNYYVLYNSLTNIYLDGGGNHRRDAVAEEELSNPYLRWNFIAV